MTMSELIPERKTHGEARQSLIIDCHRVVTESAAQCKRRKISNVVWLFRHGDNQQAYIARR